MVVSWACLHLVVRGVNCNQSKRLESVRFSLILFKNIFEHNKLCAICPHIHYNQHFTVIFADYMNEKCYLRVMHNKCPAHTGLYNTINKNEEKNTQIHFTPLYKVLFVYAFKHFVQILPTNFFFFQKANLTYHQLNSVDIVIYKRIELSSIAPQRGN